MQQDRIREMEEQMDRLTGPMQRMTALALNGFERLSSFQMESLQDYTRFAVRQWRDMLEVRDDRSLREFLDKRQQAAEEFTRKLSDDAQVLARIGQDWLNQAQKVSERNMQSFAEAAKTTLDQAREQAERGTRSAREASEQATRRAS